MRFSLFIQCKVTIGTWCIIGGPCQIVFENLELPIIRRLDARFPTHFVPSDNTEVLCISVFFITLYATRGVTGREMGGGCGKAHTES